MNTNVNAAVDSSTDTRTDANIEWLFARQRFGVHVGLARIRALLSVLGDPQRHFDTVLVGGTNGKGSTCATLSAMLQAEGRRVGLFTSPHLTHFAERFVVNGQPLPADEVARALATVRPHAEVLGATFFEIVVALGVLLFAQHGVELAVMEVGLGGRLDATNVLEPVLSIITNVALDHTEVLGESVEAIAQEKAGILRAGKLAVTAAEAEVLPVLQATGAQLTVLPPVQLTSLGFDGWQVTLPTGSGPLRFCTPLLGEHGAYNAALAALAAVQLGVSTPAIQRGAAHTSWPGRLEKLTWLGHPDRQPRTVLLDGAHNPAGAAAVALALRSLGLQSLGSASLPVVFGAAADKDIAGVAQALRSVAGEVILTRALLSPRAADPVDLAPYFEGVPVRLSSSPAEALGLLPAGLALACGSLYLVGELRPLLLGQAAPQAERWQ